VSLEPLSEPTPDLEELVAAAVAKELEAIRRLAPAELRTCLHEAAHAVVGWRVGDMPLIDVAVGPDGGGATRRESVIMDVGSDEALLRARVERAIVSTYAGSEADARCPQLGPPRPCIGDLRLVDKLASYVEFQHADLRRLREVSRWAVHDAWPLIEALAAMLRTRRRLSGGEVERFLAARGHRCDYDLTPLPSRGAGDG